MRVLMLVLPLLLSAAQAQPTKAAKVDPAEKAWTDLMAKRDAAIAEARKGATSQQEFQQKLKETLAGLDEEIKAFLQAHPSSPQAFDARLELANLLGGLFGKRDEAKTVLAEALKSAKTVDQFSSVARATAQQERKPEAAVKILEDAAAAAKNKELKADLALAIMPFKGLKEEAAQKEFLTEFIKAHPDTKAAKRAGLRLESMALAEGSAPLEMTDFKDIDGKQIRLADYKGKVVLIDFWATWCGPCMRELPNVLKAYADYHDKGFEILGISFDRDRASFDRVVKEQKMTWRHYYDGKFWSNEIGWIYGVSAIPKTILLDKQGKIAAINLRGEKLIAKVGELLGAEE